MPDMPKIVVNFDKRANPEVDFRSVYCCPVNYCDLLVERGVLVLPSLPVSFHKSLMLNLVDMADGFLFIGGADYPAEEFGLEPDEADMPMDPRRVRNDVELFKAAWASSKPILGICAGLQLAVLVHGGKLVRNLPAGGMHRPVSRTKDSMHAVRITSGKLRAILGGESAVVNSAHHQGVRPEDVPADKIQVAALAPDGVVEALERKSKGFGLFVQWHPERHPSIEHRKKIFDSFVKAVEYSFQRRSNHGRTARPSGGTEGRYNRFGL